MRRFASLTAAALATFATLAPALAPAAAKPAQARRAAPSGTARLRFDPAAFAQTVPLALEAMQIASRASRREAAHHAANAARGVAEVPASKAALRYTIDTGGLGDFLFDDWGELYIDRRFVTAEELETIKRIEAFVRVHLIEPYLKSRGAAPRAAGAAAAPSVPKRPALVFRGFEDERYQRHDKLIERMVGEFNAAKAKWCGGSEKQAAKIADLTPALVKAHMIEESGGNGPQSIAAWAVDPLQVNVPGDWGREKELVGLVKPRARNEGNVTNNVRAAIMYLSRKGFGASARPAAERPEGFFDGWLRALQRYNGRRDRTDTDRWYSDEYAEKIVKRAENPDAFVPIEIKLKKKEPSAPEASRPKEGE